MNELLESPASFAIAEYSATAAALVELKSRLQNVAYDVSTGKGLDVAKKDRAEVRGLRVALEAKRVELKAPALERSRLIDAEAKALTAELVAAAQKAGPRLLAALKGVVRVADRDTDEFIEARAAIAEAEGGVL